MEVQYKAVEKPTEKPCLMKNEFGEVFLVTEGVENETYVTRISSGSEGMETWKSDLKDYKPLPKGCKVEIIN